MKLLTPEDEAKFYKYASLANPPFQPIHPNNH